MKLLTKLLIAAGVFLSINSSAQSDSKFMISMINKEIAITKAPLKSTEVICKYYIDSIPIGDTLEVDIVANINNSSLPATDYEILHNKQTLTSKNNGDTILFLVTIFPDSIPDKQRTLLIDLVVFKNKKNISSLNLSKDRMTSITTKKSESINQYNYLAYVGTNFDLVDGIQAKNLFFATNIFVPNSHENGFKSGFFLNLYGNRNITSVDTLKDVIRPYQAVKINDTTSVFSYEQTDAITKFSSENIGAYFSPLININHKKFKIKSLSSSSNLVQLYFSPSAEFIWQRIAKNTEYLIGDSAYSQTRTVSSQFPQILNYPRSFNSKSNQFKFNKGLGLYINHQNKNITVSIYFAAGWTTIYTPESSKINNQTYKSTNDYFFSGRAWITEASTGITIQAEITNTLKSPMPQYVVTLSKAINFSSLSTLFAPLSKI
ncbi:MAG: hypothetical protein IM638_13560 [Bacteroidetes bacterium]|nr:hypothetical protein [Bacteroidota bacterium]